MASKSTARGERIKAFAASTQVEELFLNLAKDAGNWSGTPLFGEDGTYKPVIGYREDRGLLTHLKRAGLVTTINGERGALWVDFTAAGVAKAKALGVQYFLPWSERQGTGHFCPSRVAEHIANGCTCVEPPEVE